MVTVRTDLDNTRESARRLRFEPSATISATDVQEAIEEVAREALTEIDIALFGPVGTSDDTATFLAARDFMATYGAPVGVRMRPTHTIVDNIAADGNLIQIVTNQNYFLGAPGGSQLTLQSTSPNNRTFFHYTGALGTTCTLASNAAKNAGSVVLTSGASWIQGDNIYVVATRAGVTRTFIREVKANSPSGTLRLYGRIPFAIATTDTLTIYRLPAANFITGGGFRGKVDFIGTGVTGNNTRAVAATIARRWWYEDLTFDGFKGNTPGTGATGAMYLNVGYQNRGRSAQVRDSGSANTSDITFTQQSFGVFGDCLSDVPFFGPAFGQGDSNKLNHLRVNGCQSTRSFKIQSSVKLQINDVEIEDGADTGLYVVIGSDDCQIGNVRTVGMVGIGTTISDSKNVQIGNLHSRDNGTDLYIDIGSAPAMIGTAQVGDLAKVSIAPGSADIGKMHDMDNNVAVSYTKGVIDGSYVAYTPTVTAQIPGVTPPTFTANAKFTRLDAKSIECIADVTVTAANTGLASIQMTLPVTAADGLGGGGGREVTTGENVTVSLSSTTTALINLEDGSTPIITGRIYRFSFSYEAAAYA